uniref:Short-chain dehydrogenase reductase 2a n=1 Tax=Ananas comosus var. bracteatus TaxID=296719 RepID=A0A6V7QG30_ANACO|nr:unnamed protein product [Ananas comosus var. bracteatus]
MHCFAASQDHNSPAAAHHPFSSPPSAGDVAIAVATAVAQNMPTDHGVPVLRWETGAPFHKRYVFDLTTTVRGKGGHRDRRRPRHRRGHRAPLRLARRPRHDRRHRRRRGGAPRRFPGPHASFVRCDVGDEADIERLVDRTVAHHGRLDVLVNNAAVLGRQAPKSILHLDADELDRVLRVNVRGAALGMKHAARVMVPRRSGCIISVASVAGVLGGLGPHAYTASKHALVGLTKNAACELGAHGIRVNCISPFGVATTMLVNAWRDGDDDDDDSEAAEVTKEASTEEVESVEEMVRGWRR